MNYNKAVFEKAYGTFEQLEQSDMPEICFSGRSNAGKSSLINKVLNRKSLARVSATPGKTVTINFYKVDSIRLVDLPGYGYAKVPFAEKSRWSDLMEGYFNSNRDIRMIFQLIDMRHPATEFDLSMLDFLSQMNMPFSIILTKCDKLNKTEFKNRLEEIKQELCEFGSDFPIIPFSSLKGIGVDDVKKVIEDSLK